MPTPPTPDEWDEIRPSTDFAKQPAEATARLDPMRSIVGLDEPTAAQMLHFYDHPHLRPKGETTHFPEYDQIFKWVPGWTNLSTAYAGVGKSEFKRQLLLLRAFHDQKKSCNWVPEDSPRAAFFDALIHSLTGQDPDPLTRHHNPLPRRYYQRAMEWVREYFFVIQPVKGQGRTPEHVLDLYENARVKLGCAHFNTDPWHKLDHTGEAGAGGGVAYLRRELARYTDWCSETQTYLDITINPKSMLRPSGEAFPVPDTDHLSGGALWGDFAATITSYDRPNRHVTRSDPSFAIYTRKLKNYRRADAQPGSIGEGSENPDVLITFDAPSARYLINGASPLSDPRIQAIFAPEVVAPAPRPASPLGTPGIRFGGLPASLDFA